jgi:hypothetical protein
MYDSVIEVPPHVRAVDIPPALLDGLIPVLAPAFIGKDGKTKMCRGYIIRHHKFSCDALENMPMIVEAVNIAQHQEWEYLLGIFLVDNVLRVRGC